MKLREIKNIGLEELYWFLVFGRSNRKATMLELRSNNFKGLPAPFFFLSTGRCGTQWFAKMLSFANNVKAFHEPKPNLGIQGRKVYEIYRDMKLEPGSAEKELISETFLAAREQIIRYSFKTGKRFIETNNHITFFAFVLHDLFPNARFVHLNRHPAEFVRSAIRRNFYNDNIEDLKRIHPIASSLYAKKWEVFSQLEKNAWLWVETNQFIEDFREHTGAKVHYFNFNMMTQESIGNLLDFMNLPIDARRIQKLLTKRKNVQKSGNFETYNNWAEDDKSALKAICGEAAKKYGYKL